MKAKKQIIVSLIGVFVLIISFFFDKAAFSFVNLIKNQYLDYFFGAITHFGSVIIVLIIMTTLFLWEEHKREWIPVLWASFLTTFILVVLLKIIIARERPFDVVIISFFGMMNYSFPSLHAASSFTAIATLDREFPMFKWFWILFAFIVGFSRIYLNVHYLSDVVAGALLGYIIGYFFVHFEEKFKLFKRFRIFRR